MEVTIPVNIRHKITKRSTDREKKVEHHAEEMSRCDPRKADELSRPKQGGLSGAQLRGVAANPLTL